MEIPLWRPHGAWLEQTNLRRFMVASGCAGAARSPTTRRCIAGRSNSREILAESVDFAGIIGERGDACSSTATGCPARVVSRCAAQLRREPAAAARRRRRHRLPRRGQARRRLSHASSTTRSRACAQALRRTASDRATASRLSAQHAGNGRAMLATAAIGAVWSSCSPDFGVQGVLDRFGQIEPKVLIAGRRLPLQRQGFDISTRRGRSCGAAQRRARRASCPIGGDSGRAGRHAARGLAATTSVAPFAAREIAFERLPFDHPALHPLFVGHDGRAEMHRPWRRRHAAAAPQGTSAALRHLPGDRVFYFTTCGWMMWNWLVWRWLASDAACSYDGSPFHPGPTVLFDFADEERIDVLRHLGQFIDASRKRARAGRDHRSARSVRSSPRPARRSRRRVSISSTTTSSAICTSPRSPAAPTSSPASHSAIRRCRCGAARFSAAGLGMAVDVFDDDGKPARGEKGELVCTRPFPSMPLGFWNDPDGANYRAAYFERFPSSGATATMRVDASTAASSFTAAPTRC